MDELVTLLEDIIKMIPMDKLEPEVADAVRHSLIGRAAAAVEKVAAEVAAKAASIASDGSTTDASAKPEGAGELPAIPSHWVQPGPSDEPAPAPVAAAPAPAPAPAPVNEAALAGLAPAPGLEALPSTTVDAQLAAAQAAQAAPAPSSGATATS